MGYPARSGRPGVSLLHRSCRLRTPRRSCCRQRAQHADRRFAHSLEWWPDEASYKAATSDLQLAPKSFIAVGMFKDSGAPPSSGLFTGIVKWSQRLVNRATAQEFLHVQVDTLSGEIDVVADLGSVQGVPALGGVVKATCWLCSVVS